MEADAKAGSSKGIAVASQSKDLESYHASANARDEAPAEARAANGRAATVGRDGTFQSDAAASLSEEVSHIGAACTLYQLRQEAMPPLCSWDRAVDAIQMTLKPRRISAGLCCSGLRSILSTL